MERDDTIIAADSGETPEAGQKGFTLVELLALCVVVTLVSLLLLPTLVRGQQRATQASCQSNLRQIGIVLQTYAAENNDNLPGPLFPLVKPRYEQRSTNQLAWFVAERLGPRAISERTGIAPLLVCPAQAADSSAQAGSAASYVLNQGRASEKTLPAPPFGQPNNPAGLPLKLSCIATSTAPALCWAVSDADKGNVNPTLSGWNQLPYQPVHSKVRNQLYFDWHVDGRRW